MRPDTRFLKESKSFWAYVRTISQQIGYTQRGTGQIKVPEIEEIVRELRKIGLDYSCLLDPNAHPTALGKRLLDYFRHRAMVLNRMVEPLLMDAAEAGRLYRKMRKKLQPQCPQPMNKQKGEKKKPAYLTCMVNMLIEAHANGHPCDYDPRELTTVTRNGRPLRTLARRIDGAFPRAVNPVAVWEIKEYYFTTTFGSRIADGVYETLLDGMELEELRKNENIDIKHYLIVDSHYTWWECGRSYLCRLIDMLHMGYVDEIIFGKEAVERIPILVKQWLKLLSTK